MHHNRYLIIGVILSVAGASSYGDRSSSLADTAVATKPSKVRMAAAENLKVNVFVDKANFVTGDHPRQVGVVAYLINTSTTPVRVYLPGLVGPSITPGGNREAIPFEMRASGDYGIGDFIVLRPGEGVARTVVLETFSEQSRLSAYYAIYIAGHEGSSDSIAEILSSTGAVHKKVP
jgi:hypothetical protein